MLHATYPTPSGQTPPVPVPIPVGSTIFTPFGAGVAGERQSPWQGFWEQVRQDRRLEGVMMAVRWGSPFQAREWHARMFIRGRCAHMPVRV